MALSADAAILPYGPTANARIKDLVRNDPTAGAAVDRLVDMIVGQGLRLSSKPDAEALGISVEEGHEFGRAIEREWRAWANDPRRFCDARRQSSANGLFRQQARSFVQSGEACAVLTWRDDVRARYATCVMPVDPDRLSNPQQSLPTMMLRGGVEMDSFGAPVAYHVRNAHAADWWAYEKAWEWTRVPRETSWGRPVFVHGFEPEEAGQTRALSAFASLVTGLRKLGKFADAEISSAAANALLAAFVESDLPPEEVAQRLSPGQAGISATGRSAYMNELASYFEKAPPKVGGTRIPVMPPGSKITMNAQPRQTTAYPTFERAFLNRFASRLGLSGEQLSMDFSQTNYSSARAALNEAWRAVKRMSAVFTEQVVTPIYFAVIEEAFDRGYIKAPKGAPDFYDAPGAWLNARWIGPGRGFIDPVREAEASGLRIASELSTLEAESAEQGNDYEETMQQLAREQSDRRKYGLPEPAYGRGKPADVPLSALVDDKTEKTDAPASPR